MLLAYYFLLFLQSILEFLEILCLFFHHSLANLVDISWIITHLLRLTLLIVSLLLILLLLLPLCLELHQPPIILFTFFKFHCLDCLVNLRAQLLRFDFLPEQFYFFTFSLDFPFQSAILRFQELAIIKQLLIT